MTKYEKYESDLDRGEREFLARAEAEREKDRQEWLDLGKSLGRQIERDLASYHRSLDRLFAFLFGLMAGFAIALWITSRIVGAP